MWTLAGESDVCFHHRTAPREWYVSAYRWPLCANCGRSVTPAERARGTSVAVAAFVMHFTLQNHFHRTAFPGIEECPLALLTTMQPGLQTLLLEVDILVGY